ncbi:ATP-binding protein [Maribacter sp. X9]|uniref:tetratricopeptide repeat-containing sensor histidine kinase n=1 Tax=Maribacter sp. X9 TaxID=3402159 RepID=UPI003AF37412
MKFKTVHKIPLLIFLPFLLSYNMIVAQMDSIRKLKEKITTFSEASNFTGRDTTYINLINNLSYRLRYTELDSMELLAKSALDLSKSIKYRKGELEALTNFSAFNLHKGNTVKTIQYGEKVLHDSEINRFPRLQMKVYNQLGQAYFITQDYPLTYTQFLKALDLGEASHDEDYKFKMNMNVGTMFNLLEDYEEAVKYYLAADEATAKLNDTSYKGMVSANLAHLYVQTGDFEKAEGLLLKSIEIFQSQEVLQWLAFSYATYAQLNLKLSNYEIANDNYLKALNVHTSLTDVKGRADINYGLGKANLGLKNKEKAENYITESLNLYKSFNLKTGLEKCYRVLFQIKKEQGEISESLNYLELSDKLANDIFKERNKRNLNMLNAKLNFEKEKENLKVKNELEIGKQRKYVQLSLVAFLTSLIVALLIFRSHRRERSLNKKLENQALVLNENQKILKNINSNQDRLFSIVGHDLRGPIISLKELIVLYLEDSEGKTYFEKFAPQLRDDLEQVQFTMDNLLHWGKTQMKGSSMSIEKIFVKKELEIISQLFRKELEKKSITEEIDVSDNLFVYADLDHFKVIFRNLISNAIKFTPNKGKITISAEREQTNIIIKVLDTGVGMSEDVIHKLFKNTEHFSSFGTNLEKGTGLGLRLAKEMAIKNGGTIYVQSKLNNGSLFFVKLPSVKA